jgi:hypothetical protein
MACIWGRVSFQKKQRFNFEKFALKNFLEVAALFWTCFPYLPGKIRLFYISLLLRPFFHGFNVVFIDFSMGMVFIDLLMEITDFY